MTTFSNLKTNVQGTRFDSTQATQIGRIINLKMVEIWNSDERWEFRQSPYAPVTAPVGNGYVSGLPTDLGKVMALYDDDGVELQRLNQDDFDALVLPDVATGTRAAPYVYKVVDLGGPAIITNTPDANYSLSLGYLRKTCYMAGGTVLTPGIMVNNTDTPAWDSAFHDVLEIAATVAMLRLENDPSAETLDAEYDEALAAMRAALIADYPGLQYGRSGLVRW